MRTQRILAVCGAAALVSLLAAVPGMSFADFSGGDFDFTVGLPEPESLALIAAGAIAFLLTRGRRGK